MTQTEAPTVDNGVNIEALRGARQALTDAPEAGAVPVARSMRVGERHAQPLDHHRLLWPRRSALSPPGVHHRGGPPRSVPVGGQRL